MTTILIPGFMLDDDLWSDIAPALSACGSLYYADPTRGVSIADMAREVLRHAPDQFNLVGFSMGGYVARELVRMAPERVSKLVLIATSARGDTELQKRRKAVAIDTADHAFRGVSRRAIAQSLAPDREGDAAMIERIHQMSVRLGGEVFGRQASFVREGDENMLAAIRCPTLVVAGRQDRLRSIEESAELARGIPDARLEELDTGHMIPLEAPRQLERLLVAFFKE